MNESTAEGWFFARDREKHGPVSWSRLQHLAKTGWLAPDDMVWHPSLPEWTQADRLPGLHRGSLSHLWQSVIPGVRAPAPKAATPPKPATPAPRREQAPAPKDAPVRPAHQEAVDVDVNFSLRHLMISCGVLLTALGIAFAVIRPSSLAGALIVSGVFIVAAGLAAELGRFLARIARKLERAWQESAAHRLRAKELAVEQQRLAVEAARLAAAQQLQPPQPVVAAGEQAPPSGDTGRVVVINTPPVQKWSPLFAAVLSFFIPGLGQLYKGQIINAVVWFFAVGFGYVALVVPGLILHLCCVIGAASGNPWTEGTTTLVRE
jgi:TM2 domain-containing membrane protein YozV